VVVEGSDVVVVDDSGVVVEVVEDPTVVVVDERGDVVVELVVVDRRTRGTVVVVEVDIGAGAAAGS
jgi:hypothetical protein